MKIYVTFGQVHTHSVAGKTLDKDTIAVIECQDRSEGRARAFELFGGQFMTDYNEDQIRDIEHYFPKGYVEV